MTRKPALLVILTLAVSSAVFAEGSSPLSLSFVPSFNLPLGTDSQAFGFGGGGNLVGEYRMPFLPILFAGAEAGYSYLPLQASTTASLISGGDISLISAGVLVGARLDFLRSFSVRATAGVGYWYGFLNGSSTAGSDPFASIGVDFSYTFIPSLSIGLGAAYRDFFGMYNDIAVTLGLSYNFLSGSAQTVAPAKVQEQPPAKPAPLSNAPTQAFPDEKNKGIAIYNLSFNKVFPIFHAWYDSNPLGKVTIRNTDSSPATDITVSLFTKRYMDEPKECAVIPVLKRVKRRTSTCSPCLGTTSWRSPRPPRWPRRWMSATRGTARQPPAPRSRRSTSMTGMQ